MATTKQPAPKPSTAIAVDDEEMATLVEALRGHGLARDYCGASLEVFHRGYGSVLVWPADRQLLVIARDAFAEVQLAEPHLVNGYEADYLAMAEARKRGIPRQIFKNRWSHDGARGFFVAKRDAQASQTAYDIAAAQPKFNRTRQRWGGEDEDEGNDD